jgi:hypothetical protein
MTTLHIMLASGENLPNLIPAIASLSSDPGFKADTALILTSADMRKQASKLKQVLEHSGVGAVQIHPENCPDHDIGIIREWAGRKAEEIIVSDHDNRYILNLTGGTKLMTIAFLEAFRQHNAEMIYCDTLHDRIEYIENHQRDPKLPVNVLNLKTYLAAQGYRLKDGNMDTGVIEARKELTQNLAGRASRIEQLISRLNSAWHEYDTQRNSSAKVMNDHLDAEEKTLFGKIKALGLLRANHTFRDESAARYLGGGWLEEWCWIVGRELEKNEPGRRLKSNRWGINLEIVPFDATSTKNGYALNELDAVYIHRNRMLLIECKTGVQIRHESQNILNKLEALGQQFGGRLNRRWLLTARRVDPKTQAWERANRYRIRILGPQEIGQLKERIQEWMTT